MAGNSFRVPLSRRAKHLLRLIKMARYKDIQQHLTALLNQEIARTQQTYRRIMEAARRQAAEKLRLNKKREPKVRRASKEPILQQQQARQAAPGQAPARKPSQAAHHRNARLTPEQAARITSPERRPVRAAAVRARQRLEGKRRPVTVPSASPRIPALVHVGGGQPPRGKQQAAVRPVNSRQSAQRAAARRGRTETTEQARQARQSTAVNHNRKAAATDTLRHQQSASRFFAGLQQARVNRITQATPAGGSQTPAPARSNGARPAPATASRAQAVPVRKIPVPLPSQTVARSAAARSAPRSARMPRTPGRKLGFGRSR